MSSFLNLCEKISFMCVSTRLFPDIIQKESVKSVNFTNFKVGKLLLSKIEDIENLPLFLKNIEKLESLELGSFIKGDRRAKKISNILKECDLKNLEILGLYDIRIDSSILDCVFTLPNLRSFKFKSWNSKFKNRDSHDFFKKFKRSGSSEFSYERIN